MSDDSKFNLNIQYPPSRPIKIRSRNKRRILRYLAERSSTVSEVAIATGIRVPHASAEIRRLRNDTLLDSDMPSGSRGGKLHLDRKNGWGVLKSDELAMASEAKTISMEERGYCILFRDGPNLLLGLTDRQTPHCCPFPTGHRRNSEVKDSPVELRGFHGVGLYLQRGLQDG